LIASGSRAERTRPAYDATQEACYFGIDLRIVHPGLLFVLSILSILSDFIYFDRIYRILQDHYSLFLFPDERGKT